MLELKDICYTLPDGKEILKHIDLTVRDNEFMVITGPNGGGKSTLAKLIAGIVTPTSGQILLDGQDITGLDITNRANIGISFAFQQPVRSRALQSGICSRWLRARSLRYGSLPLSHPGGTAWRQLCGA